MRAEATSRGVPSGLPATFTYADARRAGLTKHRLYALRDHGVVEPLARGLYRRVDAPAADLGLIAIAAKAPLATICLATALARHGLSDAIPAATDIALPRGARHPTVETPVQWHWFDRPTFEIGREPVALDRSTSIGIYTPERSIVDAFRTRGTEGHELAYEALRRWLRRRGSQPGDLLALAHRFPRAATPLRNALEALL